MFRDTKQCRRKIIFLFPFFNFPRVGFAVQELTCNWNKKRSCKGDKSKRFAKLQWCEEFRLKQNFSEQFKNSNAGNESRGHGYSAKAFESRWEEKFSMAFGIVFCVQGRVSWTLFSAKHRISPEERRSELGRARSLSRECRFRETE